MSDTNQHSSQWWDELEGAISLLEYRGDEPFIRGQVISRLRDVQTGLREQLQAADEFKAAMVRANQRQVDEITSLREQLETAQREEREAHDYGTRQRRDATEFRLENVRLLEQLEASRTIIEAVARGKVGPAHGVLARDILNGASTPATGTAYDPNQPGWADYAGPPVSDPASRPPVIEGPMPGHHIPIQPEEWEGVNPANRHISERWGPSR